MIILQLESTELEALIEEAVRKALIKNQQRSESFQETQKVELPPHDLMNVEQTAQFLNLTKATIYTKVSRGELPVMKKGKRLYFSKLELLKYLQSGRKKTQQEIEVEAEAYILNQKKGLNNGF